MLSSEDRIWDDRRTSSSATVGLMHGRSRRGSHDGLACGGGGFWDDFKAPSLQVHLQRYLCARNAPYTLHNLDNPLILQQMRPPSERTTDASH